MDETHWIDGVYLKDGDTIVALMEIAWNEADGTTGVSFDLPAGTGPVMAYAHCNLHDTWVADAAV